MPNLPSTSPSWSRWRHFGFAVPLRLRTSRGELRLMTTVTTFATAVDVTLAELKLEAFLPADLPNREALQRAGHASTGPASQGPDQVCRTAHSDLRPLARLWCGGARGLLDRIPCTVGGGFAIRGTNQVSLCR